MPLVRTRVKGVTAPVIMEDGFVSNSDVSRRSFLGRSLAGISLASLPAWYADEAAEAGEERNGKKVAANDQINVACIGPGGSKGGFRQGLGDTRNMSRKPGVKVIAVCDVDRTHADEGAKVFGADCRAYYDYREVLDRRDVDAVVIGTPDHWHAVIAIAAMKAGKDVYCEKPLTLTVQEGRKISDTAQRRNKVFQTGSQQRSDARFRLACELVRNGRIGKIHKVEARLPNGTTGGPFPVTPPPADLNWDMWLGPAPYTEYIKERVHGNFRHWYEYSGGMMTDWGAHHLDITQWALGMDESGPLKIEASSEGILKEPFSGNDVRLYKSDDHVGNFVECVRSRKDPICTAEIGHRSATVCHLGNISLRLGGRALAWDPEAERFTNDDEANRMLDRPHRKPYTL